MYDEAMTEQELIDHLCELGLSTKEAGVYVASLALGAATVQQLAERSGIKRVTVYVILEALMGLGLMSQTNRGKKTLFISEDPTNLQRLLENKERELVEQRSHLSNLVPALQAMGEGAREMPAVRLYDTADGIKTLMHSFIEEAQGDKSEGVCGFSNLDQLYSYFPEFRQTHANPARTKAGIASRFLYGFSEGPVMKAYDRQTNRQSRWIPLDKYPAEGDFTIVGNKIMFLAFGGKHPVGITIESGELARGMRTLFNMAWDLAKTHN